MALRIPNVPVLAAVLVLTLTSLPAAAQWMWKDEAGHVMASDQPPPIGTPQSRILKEPRKRAQAEPAPVAVDKDAPKSADAGKSIADRDLESKVRQKEQAEAAKKADDEAAKAVAMKENCAAVKSNVAALQAGGRAARYNDKGEKVYIDDAERQSEIARQQAQAAQYCK